MTDEINEIKHVLGTKMYVAMRSLESKPERAKSAIDVDEMYAPIENVISSLRASERLQHVIEAQDAVAVHILL